MNGPCEIAHEATIEMTLFRSLVDTHGERESLVWSDLVDMFREPSRLPTSRLQRTDDGRWSKPRDLAGYAPATFRGDKRSLENVERVFALLLDYDDGATSQADALAVWQGFAAFAHSTFNSSTNAPRFRVELQLSRSVTRDEHAILWRWARARVAAAGHAIDEATKDASRFWFSPVMPDDAAYDFAVLDGAPLDVDAIIATATPPALHLVNEPASIPMADRERRARAYADKLDAAVSGARGHDSAFRAALKVAHGFDLDEPTALRVLSTWNARCRPPWNEADLRHKIRDALSKSHAVERGAMLRERERATETPREAESPAWIDRVVPVASEWFTTAPPKRTWLLRDARADAAGVLPLGRVGQIVAEGGAGKTMLLAQLAVCVATATKWLGAFDVVSPGRVLLALGEEDNDEIRRRLYRAARAVGSTMPPDGSIVALPLAGVTCPMIETDTAGNPRETDFLRWLRGYVTEHGPWSLVVVDPLSRFAGADAETDNAAGTRYVQALESLAALGPTVLSSHHTNKLARGGAKVDAHGARGSSSIVDGVRWVATLGREQIPIDDPDTRKRLGEIVTLSFVKSNYSRRGEAIELRYDADNGGALVPLDDTDRAIVREARAGSSTRGAKVAQRETERDQVRELREQREADKRAAREAEKIAKVAAEHLAEERALVAVLRERPGMTTDVLRSALAAKLRGCTRERMNNALARLGAAITRSTPPGGAANAKGHTLDETLLPENLR